MADIAAEREALIKKVQEQPGIRELMEVYGQYEELMLQTSEYLFNTTPRPAIATSDRTEKRLPTQHWAVG